MKDERERVAEELRRIRDQVRARALHDPVTLPEARPPRAPEKPGPEREPAPEPAPERPDPGPVNAGWDSGRATAGGLWGQLLRRALRPFVEAQVAWNARQVQLDNALLDYLDARLDHTHRHYDRVLGLHGRHMADIDERHLILQEELVAHVHDLVKRIDLVLAEAEKGRLSLEFALRDLRARLEELERRLGQG